MNDSLVVIRMYLTSIDAELAASALEAAGISAVIRADDCGGVQNALWVGSGIQLLVPGEDAESAAAVLDTPAAATGDA